MTNILITGGCGFIGSNLIRFLIEKTNWNIKLLDNLSSGKLEYNKDIIDNYERLEFFKGDICNNEDITELVDECGYIVNLAAQTSVIESIQDPNNDHNINVKGLLNLLSVCKEGKVKKFIHASSAAAVGNQKMPMDENKVPKPISPYGASKLAGEGYCCAFSNSFNINSVALRFSNVYGPLSFQKGSVVAKFIKRIIKKESLEVYGDGKQTRDFIHVNDICKGIYFSLIKDTGLFNVIQLGTGTETSVNELIEILKYNFSQLNIEFPQILYTKERTGEIYRNYTSISKAKRIINFSIDYDIQKGLHDTILWFMSEYKK
ncbi:MAG: NAD-dependent epimerase/dehydratase family protein [Candidatus Lokiarchaeota archaeon]